MTKVIAGRGPIDVVLEPARLPELRGFEVAVHEGAPAAPAGWTATRSVGTMEESLRLDASLTQLEAGAVDPEAEVEWTVTVGCRPDGTAVGGHTTAGAALISGAIAFWVTYESLAWLPRKPSVHFSLATLLVVVTFGVSMAILHKITAVLSKVLVARMVARPTRSMRARVDRLAAFAAAIPELGLVEGDAAGPRRSASTEAR